MAKRRRKVRKADKLEFVEQMGSLYEQFGAPPMAGRIVGWLMICEPELQTAAQLAEILRASKGSISTMTRYLLQMQTIERVKKPGERAAYFCFARRPMSEVMARRQAMFAQIEKLTERGLELLDGTSAERREPLQQLHDFHVFMRGQMADVVQRWERTQGKRSKR
jgi:DNA-binding transcriptional regulator GbsR (MarR family)